MLLPAGLDFFFAAAAFLAAVLAAFLGRFLAFGRLALPVFFATADFLLAGFFFAFVFLAGIAVVYHRDRDFVVSPLRSAWLSPLFGR